jgi:hypothetical protein
LFTALLDRFGMLGGVDLELPDPTEFTRRNRQRALAELLNDLAAERGRLETAEDQAEIARYMSWLGGVAEEGSPD